VAGPTGAVAGPTGAVADPTGAVADPTGAVAGATGTIAPGASIAVNRAHAPDQPCGVSGHHSIGGDCGDPTGQIP
jgi:hypothetical protein